MSILLVDDEAELVESLQRALSREGYRVSVAMTGTEAAAMAIASAYELLILDWMLPGLSGLELCHQLRSRGIETPVLFLTAKDTIADRVRGLDTGADDYLVKPFELSELLARVRALLRRPPMSPEAAASVVQTLTLADLHLDRADRMAYRGDRAIELTEKESQLLAYGMQHPHQLLSHEQIARHLWPEETEKSKNALAAQVRLLRRKLGEPPLIRSVYGKGYRFGLD